MKSSIKSMKSGIYTLIIKLNKQTEIEVGKLGILKFKKGYYAYTGSALGKTGFKRVNRHLKNSKKKKWHIDYLLQCSKVVRVFKLESEEKKRECEIAAEIGNHFEAIKGFGSTDCKCKAHLHYSTSLRPLLKFIIHIYAKKRDN
jgi:Uri superfamily endonuclease